MDKLYVRVRGWGNPRKVEVDRIKKKIRLQVTRCKDGHCATCLTRRRTIEWRLRETQTDALITERGGCLWLHLKAGGKDLKEPTSLLARVLGGKVRKTRPPYE
jgi:hypothetical protein